MKVAYVLSQGKGGLAHYTAELANAVSTYADVSVLKPSSSSADDLFNDEITIVDAFDPLNITNVGIHEGEFNIIENLRAAVSYSNISLITDIDPDVVHFTAPASLLPQMQIYMRLSGIDREYPVIETFHDVYPRKLLRRGIELDAEEPLFNAVLMNGFQALDILLPSIHRAHTIVHTESNQNTLIQRGTNPENISVVPHGTYDFFTDYDHDDVEEEQDCLLYFGNLVPTKAPDIAIKAAPLIAEKRPGVTMIVAGQGSIPAECKRLIRRYPDLYEIRNEYVPEAEVGAYFKRAQAVVIPHRRQYGHSGTLTIAYAFNTPVVTSDVGDLPQLGEGAGCGIAARRNDPRDFADAILEILENDERRAQMKANAREMAQKFSWERIAERHLKIYRDVLDHEPESSPCLY